MAENKRFFYGWLILLTCILIMGLIKVSFFIHTYFSCVRYSER